MGQEILYCNRCGKRLVGDDFTRGRAHTFNNRQFCTQCLPQEHTGAHKAIVEPKASEKAPTGRIPRPKAKPAAAAPPPAPKSHAPLMVGIGLWVIVLLGVVYVVASSPPTAPPPEPPPAGPSREKIAQELKEVEAKAQKLVQIEQFAAAADLLGEARKRHAAPEWTQAISKRIQEVETAPKDLYPALKERATAAQLRGATAEAQRERTRLAGWGRKDLLTDFDRTIAAIVPKEPLPAGAKVLMRYPEGDRSLYHVKGQEKDGSLLAHQAYNECVMLGWESGKEIFRVPEEGEVRLTFTTTSPKQVTVILRSTGPDGKIYPFNFWLQTPEAGRPQVLKFPIGRMKNWSQVPIVKGAAVDNLYIRQDDLAAVFKVHDFVIFETRR